MTDLPAECRKHSDELPLPYEVKVTLLDAAARIEQLEAALRDLIAHTCACERELTVDLHRAEFCGESLPLTNARAALGGHDE